MFKARLIISYIKRNGLEEYVLNRMYPFAKDVYVDVNRVQVSATLLKKGDRVSVRHVCRDLFEILPREQRSGGVPAGQVVRCERIDKQPFDYKFDRLERPPFEKVMPLTAVESVPCEIVYMCLIDEWCYRPVLARHIKEDIYEILPSACYGPDYEEWQFVPGTLVHCVEVTAANIHNYDLLYSGCLSGREKTKVAYSIASLT